MITQMINAFLFIDSLKFSSLILTTFVITSYLGKDGYMCDMSKLIIALSSSSMTFLILPTNCSLSLIQPLPLLTKGLISFNIFFAISYVGEF